MLKNKPITMFHSRHCDWLVFFLFRHRQSSFYWIISDGVISGVGRKWERSDSSVELMTPLTTPTLTPSLVKTSLTSYSLRDVFLEVVVALA